MRTCFIAILIALCPVFLTDATAQGTPADEEAIRRASGRYIEAWNRGDAKGIAQLFTSDARRVGPVRETNGRSQIEQLLAFILARNRGSKLEGEISSIRFLAPDVAIVQGTYKISGGTRAEGSGRVLYAVVRQDSRWLRREVLTMPFPTPVAAATSSSITVPSISEEISPVEELSAHTQDGHEAIGVLRKPPGQGPFPAVVYIHGGLDPVELRWLKAFLLKTPPMLRFLAAGYVTVAPTYRTRTEDPQAQDALRDNLAIIELVRKRPEVDPESVVVYGLSGGAELALDLAGVAGLAAVVAEEPPTVLFTGMLNKNSPKRGEKFTIPDAALLVNDPHRFYTPEIRRIAQERIARISCPVLIA